MSYNTNTASAHASRSIYSNIRGNIRTPMLSLRNIAPASDWIALLLIFWMLAAVGWSVGLARWGDLPSIIPTSLLGAAAAFAVSRMKISVFIKLIIFIVLGIAVIFWQASAPADGANAIARSLDAYKRLELWIDVAINGGVSADTVPFAIIFMTVSWTLSFAVTALTFRFRTPWIPVVALGFALLTNLSHRQGLHEQTFYLFMVATVALFAHLIAVNQIKRWRDAGVDSPTEAMWGAVRDGILLGVIVIIAVAFLPLVEVRSNILRDRWNALLLHPLKNFQSTAERLLSGIPNRNDGLLDAPNSVMLFQGGIELTDEPIMWVRSRYATLHPGRMYQEYTSSGWLSAPSVSAEASSQSRLLDHPRENEIQNRELASMTVQPLGQTDLVVPAAAVHTVDYDAKVEVLDPLAWDISLTGSDEEIAGLPTDLQELATELRLRLAYIAQERLPQAEFTPSDLPALDEATVRETMEEILTESAELGDDSERRQLTFYVGDAEGTESVDPDDVDSTREFLLKIETEDIVKGARPKDGSTAYERLMRVRTSIEEIEELSAEGDNEGHLQNAERLNEIEEFMRSRLRAWDDVGWNSSAYNIFSDPDGSNASVMRIVRDAPREQNTVKFSEPLKENQEYRVGTYVSTAEESKLAASEDDYPVWVTDRYLQLPGSIPSRVSELAIQVVNDADAETPWEKVQAIKRFLQSQVYSLQIVGPSPFDDGIDYFLFKTRSEPCPTDKPSCDSSQIKGYSQYYGSAGTVMLRSVGVPARMVAGWSAGEYVPDEGQFLIRDQDRHGWTQAYLPPYGWIDIEVTPGRPGAPRNVLVPTVPLSEIPPETVSSAEFDPDFMEDLLYLDSLALEARQFLSRQKLENQEPQQSFKVSVSWIAIPAVSLLLLLLVSLLVVWQWNMRSASPAARAYSQFTRVAVLLGYRRRSHWSAREYALKLQHVSPIFASDAETLVEAYERTMYGPRSQRVGASEESLSEDQESNRFDDPEDDMHLGKRWRRMARALLVYRIKSVLRIAPPLWGS